MFAYGFTIIKMEAIHEKLWEIDKRFEYLFVEAFRFSCYF